jgi:hypothetical protein
VAEIPDRREGGLSVDRQEEVALQQMTAAWFCKNRSRQ